MAKIRLIEIDHEGERYMFCPGIKDQWSIMDDSHPGVNYHEWDKIKLERVPVEVRFLVERLNQ